MADEKMAEAVGEDAKERELGNAELDQATGGVGVECKDFRVAPKAYSPYVADFR